MQGARQPARRIPPDAVPDAGCNVAEQHVRCPAPELQLRIGLPVLRQGLQQHLPPHVGHARLQRDLLQIRVSVRLDVEPGLLAHVTGPHRPRHVDQVPAQVRQLDRQHLLHVLDRRHLDAVHRLEHADLVPVVPSQGRDDLHGLRIVVAQDHQATAPLHFPGRRVLVVVHDPRAGDQLLDHVRRGRPRVPGLVMDLGIVDQPHGTVQHVARPARTLQSHILGVGAAAHDLAEDVAREQALARIVRPDDHETLAHGRVHLVAAQVRPFHPRPQEPCLHRVAVYPLQEGMHEGPQDGEVLLRSLHQVVPQDAGRRRVHDAGHGRVHDQLPVDHQRPVGPEDVRQRGAERVAVSHFQQHPLRLRLLVLVRRHCADANIGPLEPGVQQAIGDLAPDAVAPLVPEFALDAVEHQVLHHPADLIPPHLIEPRTPEDLSPGRERLGTRREAGHAVLAHDGGPVVGGGRLPELDAPRTDFERAGPPAGEPRLHCLGHNVDRYPTRILVEDHLLRGLIAPQEQGLFRDHDAGSDRAPLVAEVDVVGWYGLADMSSQPPTRIQLSGQIGVEVLGMLLVVKQDRLFEHPHQPGSDFHGLDQPRRPPIGWGLLLPCLFDPRNQGAPVAGDVRVTGEGAVARLLAHPHRRTGTLHP